MTIKDKNITREEEAIERIKIILKEATEYEYAVSYVTSYDADALNMAIQALEQISAIKQIITDMEYIQEDVIRYKMICKVLEDKE